MSGQLPTASSLERAWHCPSSQRLPHVYRGNRWSRRGSRTHEFMRRARVVGRDQALDELGEDPARALCEAIPFDRLPVGGDLEVALAWDYVTGEARILHKNGDRDYSAARPTEFVGTADFAGVEGARVVCPDWKSGWLDLGDPKKSLTMRFYSLAAARVAGLDEALTGFVYLREDGTARMKWAELDAFDLAETADQLRELASELEIDSQHVSEGDWCTYCPAWLSCPAKVALAASLASGVVVDGFGVQAMTLDQLGEAYRKVEKILPVAERIKEAIRERAETEDVPLGDGRVLRAVDWPSTSVNSKVALRVIAELHGDQVAAAASPPKVSQASIKRAVGNANFEATFAAIERAGGVVETVGKQVRAVKK